MDIALVAMECTIQTKDEIILSKHTCLLSICFLISSTSERIRPTTQAAPDNGAEAVRDNYTTLSLSVLHTSFRFELVLL